MAVKVASAVSVIDVVPSIEKENETVLVVVPSSLGEKVFFFDIVRYFDAERNVGEYVDTLLDFVGFLDVLNVTDRALAESVSDFE